MYLFSLCVCIWPVRRSHEFLTNCVYRSTATNCDKEILPAEKVLLFHVSATADLEGKTMKLPSVTVWIDKEILFELPDFTDKCSSE